MNNYEELIRVLNNAEKFTLCFDWHIVEKCYEAADAIEQLIKERDALLFDLCEVLEYQPDSCLYCAKDREICKMNKDCNFKWRGVTE